MDAINEWDRLVTQQVMSPMSPQELIEIGQRAAIAAPEHRWSVMKEFAQSLHEANRMHWLDTLDDYIGLVVAVTHDCIAEQALKETELHLIGQALDKKRATMIHETMSAKSGHSKKKDKKKEL